MKLGRADRARALVFEPRQRLPQIRKLDGTTPDASPEWTPSSSTRTVSVPETMPRSDVVSHSWS